jgi:hypothetical protein
MAETFLWPRTLVVLVVVQVGRQPVSLEKMVLRVKETVEQTLQLGQTVAAEVELAKTEA